MRRYVVECEISHQSQELVSIAIVPVIKHDEVWMPEHCFYGALDVPDERLDDWVRENVIPVLFTEGESRSALCRRMMEFMRIHKVRDLLFDGIIDITYFTQLLDPSAITGLQLEKLPILLSSSEIPHNALADAQGIARAITRYHRLMIAH